jgi:large subunit ribosomal protein L25
MEVGKLTVSARTEFGKGPARRYRQQGLVPGICYGHDLDAPLPIVLDPRKLRASLDPVKKNNTVIEVTIETDGGKPKTITAMIKAAQIHALRRDIDHVDFIAIDTDKTVEAEVPVRFEGKAIGVIEGGILNVIRRSITVECKPADIPIEFVLDVTNMDIGDVLHVSDLEVGPGVQPAISPKLTIVTCVAPREEEVAAPVEGELAEGEVAAEGAEGEAKPGEGDAKKADGGDKKDGAQKDAKKDTKKEAKKD